MPAFALKSFAACSSFAFSAAFVPAGVNDALILNQRSAPVAAPVFAV